MANLQRPQAAAQQPTNVTNIFVVNVQRPKESRRSTSRTHADSRRDRHRNEPSHSSLISPSIVAPPDSRRDQYLASPPPPSSGYPSTVAASDSRRDRYLLPPQPRSSRSHHREDSEHVYGRHASSSYGDYSEDERAGSMRSESSKSSPSGSRRRGDGAKAKRKERKEHKSLFKRLFGP
ncbi:hypothetical protein H2248_010282 [Termitomyces sp. 'cryptogamus']|nr:hypothetical protein H2248_010282 [Termitomyces sp. 'cryptogamus']